MSTSLLRSLPPSRQYERHLRRCAQQFHLRDDLRPLLPSNPIPSRQCLRRRQPFSTTSLRPAAGKVIQPKIKQKAQPSMTVTRKQQEAQVISRGAIPDDVGLMDQTFIMPHGKNKPSWLKDFNMRWRLEKHRLKTRIFEIFHMLNYRYFSIRPRPHLDIRNASTVGKNLHKQMYSAFAAGNLRPVESSICSGLLNSLRARISQRPTNTHLKWTLHKYLSRPRLVSYKAGIMPGADGKPVKARDQQNGFVQAIVRIHSLQSLQHVRTSTVRERGRMVTRETLVDSAGREVPDDGGNGERGAKETVEYFVVQKQLKRSREGPWMVWGTAEETTIDKLVLGRRKKREARAAAAS